jgi:transposase
MQITNSTDWREQHRLQAYRLQQKGWRNCEIAEALGVSQGAVSQWQKRSRLGGQPALLHRRPPGMPPRLSKAQLEELPSLLLAGAESYGFVGQVWTSERVAWLIKFKFGISFHRAHICRILKRIGWTVQKPVEKAAERDEAAIQKWRTERWPCLKKKPKSKVELLSG